MKVQLEQILQSLFHKPSLEEVQVEELEQLVKEHPYFSTGHFLLAQKLQRHGNGQGQEQAQKAALYFNDPLLLQWQLKQFSTSAPVAPVETPGTIEPVETAQPIQHIRQQEPEEEEQLLTWDQPVEEETPREAQEPASEEPAAIVEYQEPHHEETAEVSPLEPEEQLAVETIGPVEEAIPANDTQSFHEPAEPPASSVPSEPVIQQEEAAKPLGFDPYYTIDYFASQGIKAPVEVQPGDKLGKQLKSFTEWLKTMKRLPQAQAEAITDENEQQHIRQVAADSLEQKEVVTETMAEVLAKQGRNTEAIAIYEKLSLLDPSKSAYFAAKIENLKVN
jgi:hypothetical protein